MGRQEVLSVNVSNEDTLAVSLLDLGATLMSNKHKPYSSCLPLIHHPRNRSNMVNSSWLVGIMISATLRKWPVPGNLTAFMLIANEIPPMAGSRFQDLM